MSAPLVDIGFEADVIEWRGPAPFFFATIPEEHFGEIRFAAREASYGWGCIPVEAQIHGQAFRTSLFPRGDAYLLPLKAAVRAAAGIALGDRIAVAMQIHAPRHF